MSKINYIIGDATNPIGEGNKIITHICNDIGAWGAGFVLALSRKWKLPETKYREWYSNKKLFMLGSVQFVKVEENIVVANMIAQHGIGFSNGNVPIRYEALEHALTVVAKRATDLNASVHMPRIGCGLAGGKWEEVEKIINNTLIKNNIDVFVYDLK